MQRSTVKIALHELLNEIKIAQTQGFAEMKAITAMKADKADIAKIEGKLERHGERLTVLEQMERDEATAAEVIRSHNDIRWSTRRKVWTSIAGFVTLLATFWAPYAAVHLHF